MCSLAATCGDRAGQSHAASLLCILVPDCFPLLNPSILAGVVDLCGFPKRRCVGGFDEWRSDTKSARKWCSGLGALVRRAQSKEAHGTLHTSIKSKIGRASCRERV